MKNKQNIAALCAILAAALYAAGIPASKTLLNVIPPALLAALLYLGAGIGMAPVWLLGKNRKGNKEISLSGKDTLFVVGMIVLDVLAPILLMFGLTKTASSNASLLNNFEIVATSLFAMLLFKEKIGKPLWAAILCITVATVVLSFEGKSSLSFSLGSVFVLLACACWGLENNCTRSISAKNPMQIVVIKGIGSGLGALLIAIFLNERFVPFIYLTGALILGFFTYGLSIMFYVYAQRRLGAAKTSTFYAISPFIAAAVSFVFLHEPVTAQFLIALPMMLTGVYFAFK